MSKKQKTKLFFTRTIISALIASFVFGFTAGALTGDASAAVKTKEKMKKNAPLSTDCPSVKLRYYQALTKGVNPSSTDIQLAEKCSSKEKKIWNKNPSNKQCKVIQKYEVKKKITSMVKKKKMSWTDYFYCKATYWNK